MYNKCIQLCKIKYIFFEKANCQYTVQGSVFYSAPRESHRVEHDATAARIRATSEEVETTDGWKEEKRERERERKPAKRGARCGRAFTLYRSTRRSTERKAL